MEVGLEAGAQDVRREGNRLEVLCDPDIFAQVADAFSAAGLTPETKQITRVPNNTVDLDVGTARKVLKLLETLDDHDDVQNVSANLNIPEEAMVELSADG
jgi:transcriptional/translational regulatory protein YebC/TACO1